MRADPNALAALIRDGMVHRDLYVSETLFALEMEQLFANTWVYLGHDSQTPQPGDYLTGEVGRRPLVMLRGEDRRVRVFYNRCAHKGTQLLAAPCGHAGRYLRCPYHAWTYRSDGRLHALPHAGGYPPESRPGGAAAPRLREVAATENYRGFVFVRLSECGPGFGAYFGESLSSLDNMIDRSPEGRLEVAGAPLRYLHRCNWKMLVENQTDTCHPMIAHESSAGTAVRLWQRRQQQDPGAKKPMAVEVIAPFMSRYEFFAKMGIRVWANGHGHTGVHTSIHADYSEVPGYFQQMVDAYGEQRARAILGENRHNTIYFPNLMIKGPIQQLRVFKPLAVDRTLVESIIFRLVGAPELLLERTAMYNRLINAPTSMVGHDDLEMYERAQRGLAGGDDWVNLQRLYQPDERHDRTEIVDGTSERQMRNQFDAWLQYIVPAAAERPA